MQLRFSAVISSAVSLVRHLVFPPFCVLCQTLTTADRFVCDACFASFKPVATVGFKAYRYRVTVHGAAAYEGAVRKLILRKAGSDAVASRALADAMKQRWSEPPPPVDCIVPVPLHWRRYAKRGYNQAATIACELGKAWGVSVCYPVRRSRSTPFQSKLKAPDRIRNVSGAFVLKSLSVQQRQLLKGKHVVVVDDLCTTGATLRAVSRCLARAHPASITALVAARAV